MFLLILLEFLKRSTYRGKTPEFHKFLVLSRKSSQQKLNFRLCWHKFSFFLILILFCLDFVKPATADVDLEDASSSVYDDSGEIGEQTDIKSEQLGNPNENTTTAQPQFPEQSHANEVEKNPSEVQKAVCTITAGEVRASAEAVTTKTLKGVCGSAELQLALSNLEAKIFKELQELKSLLMLQLRAVPNKENSNCNCNNYGPTTKPTTTASPTPTITTTTKKPKQHFNNFNNVIDPMMPAELEHTSNPRLKSFEAENRPSSRDKEVFKFNNTMLADKDFKVFTYYWRLENFTKLIEDERSTTLASPRFAIKGKPLHLKAYFRHLHRDFLYLQLEYATSSSLAATNAAKGSNNIMLDMGLLGGANGRTLFKAISSNDQILFKYKIKILDQQNLRSSKDLISQEFHNLDGGFLVPNSALLASPYIKNDTLLVQLFLYL